jgi:hypothetical protein
VAGPEPSAVALPRLAAAAVLAAILSVAGPTPRPAVAQDSIDVPQYIQRLDVALQLARSGAGAPSPAAMRSVSEALGLPVMVEAVGGAVSIPPDAFLDGLSGNTALDFQRAADHLQALRDRAAGALEASAPDRGRVDEALTGAYRGISQGRGLLRRIGRGILDFIGGVLQRLTTLSGLGTALSWLAILALIAALLLLLRRFRPVPDRIAPGGRHAAPRGEPVDWRERADRALRTGDLLEAIRALYALLLSTLAGRGVVSDAPSLTAGECRAAVEAARPSLSAPVARATVSFERVVYGGKPPSQDDIQLLREAERQAGRA